MRCQARPIACIHKQPVRLDWLGVLLFQVYRIHGYGMAGAEGKPVFLLQTFHKYTFSVILSQHVSTGLNSLDEPLFAERAGLIPPLLSCALILTSIFSCL